MRLDGNGAGAGAGADAGPGLEAREATFREEETGCKDEELADVGAGGLRRTLETGVSSRRGVAMGVRAVGIIA